MVPHFSKYYLNVWYYPFLLQINDLTDLHLTSQEKYPVFLPYKNRLHQPSYKMFCTHLGHVTKIIFFQIIREEQKVQNRMAEHSFYSRDYGKSNDFMEFIKENIKGIHIIMSFDKHFFKLHWRLFFIKSFNKSLIYSNYNYSQDLWD